MSKICGICYFDSRPVSAEHEAFARTALQSAGYSSATLIARPGVLFGWAKGLDSLCGDGFAELADQSVCCWDGRIDNRGELLHRMSLPTAASDSAIAAAVYQRNGAAGLREIVGDWAACLWDANHSELVLAADYAGIRPLYYSRRDSTVYWSSSLTDLVHWTAATELDDVYAASLMLRGAPPGRSPYAGIASVPPGHTIRISREHAKTSAFWSVTDTREVSYRDERDYERHLIELFREAVRARISAASPNCAELSGGLDSSSVVCMADRLRKEAGRDRGLYTFSYTHERCPDEEYFCEVERACGLEGIHLQLQDYPPLAATQASCAAPAWWTMRFQEIARRMAALGSGVLLTGQLGDFIMGNTNDDSDQVTGWLAQYRFLRAGQEAYSWAKSLQTPIYPILWRSMRAAWSSWIPETGPMGTPGAIRGSTDDSLLPELKARLSDCGGALSDRASWRSVPPGNRRRFIALTQMLQSRLLQAPEPMQHLAFAHPFAHRPLVEFMLGIPPSVVCRPGEPRRLQRRAFADLLPPRVLNRRSKAAFTDAYVRALIPLAQAMLRNPDGIQIVERRFVDRQSLLSRLERFTQGLECNQFQLRNVILYEFWLRTRGVAPRQAAA